MKVDVVNKNTGEIIGTYTLIDLSDTSTLFMLHVIGGVKIFNKNDYVLIVHV